MSMMFLSVCRLLGWRRVLASSPYLCPDVAGNGGTKLNGCLNVKMMVTEDGYSILARYALNWYAARYARIWAQADALVTHPVIPEAEARASERP